MSEGSNRLTTVEVWTDGSGTTGAPGGYAYCMRCRRDDGSYAEKEGRGGAVTTTNNRMEMMGPIKALESLSRPCHVVITTDSEYVANPIRLGWIDSWQRSRWKNGKLKNADLWERLWKLCQQHRVQMKWTKGHAGNFYNERCDDLAGECRRAIRDAPDAASISELPFDVEGAPSPTSIQTKMALA